MNSAPANCPCGCEGDRLWVKETYQLEPSGSGPTRICYRAGGEKNVVLSGDDIAQADRLWTEPDVFRPSIHMPRWASRITLEVVSVRVERLQDISRADAIAEGVDWRNCPQHQSDASFQAQRAAARIGMCAPFVTEIDYVGGFRSLWESINGPDSWEANPWVWAIEFKRVQHA